MSFKVGDEVIYIGPVHEDLWISPGQIYKIKYINANGSISVYLDTEYKTESNGYYKEVFMLATSLQKELY